MPVQNVNPKYKKEEPQVAKAENIAGTNSERREAALRTALDKINKSLGKTTVSLFGDTPPDPVEIVPSGSIAIDIALGRGGLPRGRIIEIWGPESSGKTLFTLHAMSEFQKAGGRAAFIDAEHAFDPDWAAKIGVNIDDLVFSQPDNGEEAFEVLETLVNSGAVDIVVVDSVAALVPRKELEGDFGDATMGVQARMMSQGLRKITGAVKKNDVTVIFINQVREKIGVMFGCFQYNSRVMLADGTTEKIGKIVNQKQEIEVLSYNEKTGAIEPRKVTNWFQNGKAEEFLSFRVSNWQGSGVSKFRVTPNHQIATPEGYIDAGLLEPGDEVSISATSRYTSEQLSLVRASLLGDGSLRRMRKASRGVRFRLGHGENQIEYLDWKTSKFSNIPHTIRVVEGKGKWVDFTSSVELYKLWSAVYPEDGGKRNVKNFTSEYFQSITPAGWAMYLMDDGHFDYRTTGKQSRTAGGSGRILFCLDAMTSESQQALVEHFNAVLKVEATLCTNNNGRTYLSLTAAGTRAFMELVGRFVHPSMQYKLLPAYRNFSDYEVAAKEPEKVLTTGVVESIKTVTGLRSMEKFDIEVEGNHNYFVAGTQVHNSPKTTTGGNALKFYASVRMEIARIEQLKDGQDVIGARTRVKVVKNKIAPPYKTADFDILWTKGNEGYSRESDIRDFGVASDLIKKSGAWFTLNTDIGEFKSGSQLGQGGEKTRQYLKDNPELADGLEALIRQKYFTGEAELDVLSEADAQDTDL